MQIELRPVPFTQVEGYIADFQKRSKTHENVPVNAELVGIFANAQLAGYFIIAGHNDGNLEINQGYLNKEFRHKNISSLAMQVLEQKAKKAGYRKVILASSRTLKAYTHFMADMGYRPERIIFSKEV